MELSIRYKESKLTNHVFLDMNLLLKIPRYNRILLRVHLQSSFFMCVLCKNVLSFNGHGKE